jgi:YVTN family beta-propeller protein
VEVGQGACAVGIVSERGEAFVVNSLAGTVARIDLDSRAVVEELTAGSAPVGLTVAPEHDRVYVTNRGDGTVSVLSVVDGSECGRIDVGEGPGGVVVDPDDGRLLVANAGSGTLEIVEETQRDGVEDAPAEGVLAQLVGRRLPAFSLPDHHTGEQRTSLEWAERRYILNFFASW